MHEIVPLQLIDIFVSIAVWVPYRFRVLVPRRSERHRVLEFVPHQRVVNLDWLTVIISNRDTWTVNNDIGRNGVFCPIPERQSKLSGSLLPILLVHAKLLRGLDSFLLNDLLYQK
jgi:hypothetical protein